MPARITVVSDTHLSRRSPEATANWEAVVQHVAADPPDLVIHAGDLALDGAGEPADVTYARGALGQLSVPWRAIPGNHDIGDNPRAGQAEGEAVTNGRRQRWLDTIGPDWWTAELDGWTVIAVDAQLFGSGLDAEAEQREWLEAELTKADRSVLVSHKPVAGSEDELASAPPYRYVPAAARQWLADLLGRHDVPIVVSGHVHQYRLLELDGVRHAWAPTTWTVLPDEMQPVLGTKRGGVLSIELGTTGVEGLKLTEPRGFTQLTLVRDVPNPYDH